MSTPMLRTGRRKISLFFGGFTSTAEGGNFLPLFFAYSVVIFEVAPTTYMQRKKGANFRSRPWLFGLKVRLSLDLQKTARKSPRPLS